MKERFHNKTSIRNVTAKGYHHCGDGLYLAVSVNGMKSWIFKYTLNGRTREKGLGSARIVTIGEAKKEARRLRKIVHSKIDPLAKKTLPYVHSVGNTITKKISNVVDIISASTPLGVQLAPAVYFLINDADEIVYVGSSRNVNRRLLEWKKNDRFSFSKAAIQTCSEEVRLILEEAYIRAIGPEFNSLMKKHAL